MAKSTGEIRRLGTCLVTFGGAELGYTSGGVTVSITTDWVDINVDDFGTGPLDGIDVGTNIEATVPLAQASFDNYAEAFGMGNRAAADTITFGRTTSTSIIKKRLTLNPLNDADNVVIYQAGCISVDDLGFNNDGIRVLACHFRGYVQPSRSEGDRLFRIGGASSSESSSSSSSESSSSSSSSESSSSSSESSSSSS